MWFRKKKTTPEVEDFALTHKQDCKKAGTFKPSKPADISRPENVKMPPPESNKSRDLWGSRRSVVRTSLQDELVNGKLYCDVHETELQRGAGGHVRTCEWCIREAKGFKPTTEWQPWAPGYEQRINENGHVETRPIVDKPKYQSQPCMGAYTPEQLDQLDKTGK